MKYVVVLGDGMTELSGRVVGGKTPYKPQTNLH